MRFTYISQFRSDAVVSRSDAEVFRSEDTVCACRYRSGTDMHQMVMISRPTKASSRHQRSDFDQEKSTVTLFMGLIFTLTMRTRH